LHVLRVRDETQLGPRWSERRQTAADQKRRERYKPCGRDSADNSA
jgi:hypothetical protein